MNAMVVVDWCVMVTVVCKEKVGGQYTSLRHVWGEASARNGAVVGTEARVQAGVRQGEKSKMGMSLTLRQGNVATFGATSQRSRDC